MVRWPEPKPFISKLPCQHDKKSDRIVAKMPMSVGIQVFLLSETDCLFIIDQNSANSYPPTAKHAIRKR